MQGYSGSESTDTLNTVPGQQPAFPSKGIEGTAPHLGELTERQPGGSNKLRASWGAAHHHEAGKQRFQAKL